MTRYFYVEFRSTQVNDRGFLLTNKYEDFENAQGFKTWDALANEIERKVNSPTSTLRMKRHIRRIQSFPRVLALLTHTFAASVVPYEVDFDVVWGLIYLTLKVRTTPQYLYA